MIFIIKGFWTIVFIFIVISTFQPICHPAFFKCLSNSGTFTKLRTKSFMESTGVACSDSISHNQVKSSCIVTRLQSGLNLQLPDDCLLKSLGNQCLVVRSSVKVPEFNKLLKKSGGLIGQNVVEIAIKMKTVVRKPLMIKIIKLRFRNLDNE